MCRLTEQSEQSAALNDAAIDLYLSEAQRRRAEQRQLVFELNRVIGGTFTLHAAILALFVGVVVVGSGDRDFGWGVNSLVISAAAVFLINTVVSAYAYGLSRLRTRPELDELRDQLADTSVTVAREWMARHLEAAINENTLIIGRKARWVSISISLTAFSVALVACALLIVILS